jgi:hypothetical protein
VSRRDQKGLEQILVREIVANHATTVGRLAARIDRTGKSGRAFYR